MQNDWQHTHVLSMEVRMRTPCIARHARNCSQLSVHLSPLSLSLFSNVKCKIKKYTNQKILGIWLFAICTHLLVVPTVEFLKARRAKISVMIWLHGNMQAAQHTCTPLKYMRPSIDVKKIFNYIFRSLHCPTSYLLFKFANLLFRIVPQSASAYVLFRVSASLPACGSASPHTHQLSSWEKKCKNDKKTITVYALGGA